MRAIGDLRATVTARAKTTGASETKNTTATPIGALLEHKYPVASHTLRSRRERGPQAPIFNTGKRSWCQSVAAWSAKNNFPLGLLRGTCAGPKALVFAR